MTDPKELAEEADQGTVLARLVEERARVLELQAEAAAMRQALEWYVRCDDSTECITNQPCGTVAKEALEAWRKG